MDYTYLYENVVWRGNKKESDLISKPSNQIVVQNISAYFPDYTNGRSALIVKDGNLMEIDVATGKTKIIFMEHEESPKELKVKQHKETRSCLINYDNSKYVYEARLLSDGGVVFQEVKDWDTSLSMKVIPDLFGKGLNENGVSNYYIVSSAGHKVKNVCVLTEISNTQDPEFPKIGKKYDYDIQYENNLGKPLSLEVINEGTNNHLTFAGYSDGLLLLDKTFSTELKLDDDILYTQMEKINNKIVMFGFRRDRYMEFNHVPGQSQGIYLRRIGKQPFKRVGSQNWWNFGITEIDPDSMKVSTYKTDVKDPIGGVSPHEWRVYNYQVYNKKGNSCAQFIVGDNMYETLLGKQVSNTQSKNIGIDI